LIRSIRPPKENDMTLRRRTLLQAGAAASLGGIAAVAVAQPRTKLRVGYLHTPAVDGQIWLGQQSGVWTKRGLDLELIQFTTGLELFQAMIGGSIDMLATGAVISNFPARGQGKAFLINNIEFATAQLWVRPEIKGFADLKGKKIATTKGTTAHVFLNRALTSNNIKESEVDVVNQRMSEAVTSFISGAVPAVALWVPFNIPVRDKVKDAKMLVDASKYYPEAAIVGGWAVRNDFFEKSRPVLESVVRGWLPANDLLVTKADEALKILQSKYYQEVPLDDLKEQYKAQKVFSAGEWRKLYADKTVTKWLNQVTDFFAEAGGIQNPVKADQYFDPSIFLGQVKA
jgi:NitT/TauT family transport system substrate-binding protein